MPQDCGKSRSPARKTPVLWVIISASARRVPDRRLSEASTVVGPIFRLEKGIRRRDVGNALPSHRFHEAIPTHGRSPRVKARSGEALVGTVRAQSVQFRALSPRNQQHILHTPMLGDLRSMLRSLWHWRLGTAVAIGTLAIAIGTATSLYAFLRATLEELATELGTDPPPSAR